MHTNSEVINISLENVIESKLIQNNVTEMVIATLKEKYGGMKLAHPEDKEGYLEIKAAAKDVAKVRILATKLCKEGREEAVKAQKLWIAKEKEVVGKISEVEDALDAQVAIFDNEIKRKEEEEKRRREDAYIKRQSELTKMGASYVDGCFVLGNASFEANLVKESSEDVWTDAVLPKFQKEYEIISAARIEEERKAAEREAELEKQRAELQRQQDELAAERKRLDDEKMKQQLADEKRRNEEREAELSAARDLQNKRFALLYPVNPSGEGVNMQNLSGLSETEFDEILEQKKAEFKRKKEEDDLMAEKKRQKDIEDAKALALKEAQDQAAAEQARKIAEMDAASDKAKWNEFISKVSDIDTYEMKSSYYKSRMSIAIAKIEEIKAL
jgi:hypothetical protein